MKKQRDSKIAQAADNSTGLSPTMLLKLLELVGKVVAPSALVGALLFYFGRVRTHALYAAFGIDQSLLEFSTQDYLLRSIQIALGSMSMFLMVLLAVLWIHHGLSGLRKTKPSLLLQLAALISLAGLVLTASSYLLPQTISEFGTVSILIPAFWTIGVGMMVYGLYTYARTKTVKALNGRNLELLQMFPAWLCNWSLGLVAALLIVGTFSTVSIAANRLGQARAAEIIADPTDLPEIVVYSKSPLMLEGSGITVEQIGDNPETFQYKYSGLYLLVRSANKYFLLPGSLTSDSIYSVILPDSDGIRIEVSSGASKRGNISD